MWVQDIQAIVQVLPESPFVDLFDQEQFVAAMTRVNRDNAGTADVDDLLLLDDAQKSSVWSSGERSPISSRRWSPMRQLEIANLTALPCLVNLPRSQTVRPPEDWKGWMRS